jgi:hypothetical protein
MCQKKINTQYTAQGYTYTSTWIPLPIISRRPGSLLKIRTCVTKGKGQMCGDTLVAPQWATSMQHSLPADTCKIDASRASHIDSVSLKGPSTICKEIPDEVLDRGQVKNRRLSGTQLHWWDQPKPCVAKESPRCHRKNVPSTRTCFLTQNDNWHPPPPRTTYCILPTMK